jgi:hypothetical protein
MMASVKNNGQKYDLPPALHGFFLSLIYGTNKPLIYQGCGLVSNILNFGTR